MARNTNQRNPLAKAFVGSSPTPRTIAAPHAQGKILNVLLNLKSLGRKETSLLPMSRRLRYISRHVDLDNPSAVCEFISQQPWSSNYKGNMVLAYLHYVRFYKLSWIMPKYQREDKEFKVPTDEDISKIISHSKLKGAVFYSIVRDTGARPIEVAGLKLKSVDLENGDVYPTTAKGGRGRKLRIKGSTLAMLKRFLSERNLNLNDLVFAGECSNEPSKIAKLMEDNWVRLKNSIADKLQQPHLKTIRFYDLRHAFGSMIYYRSKDLVYTQRMLGHSSVQHTLRYIHTIDLDSEEYICKVASSRDEAKGLVEQGFEFVCDFDGSKIFRKRK